MAASATLSSKYQISIPKTVRDEHHWKAGQEFVFLPKGKGVLDMPVPELNWNNLPGWQRAPSRVAIGIARTGSDAGR